MSECADADPIDARLRQGPNRGQIHAARGFELNRGCHAIAAAHGLGDELRPEVIDQDDVRATNERAMSSCSSESTSISIVVPGGVFARAAAIAAAIGSGPPERPRPRARPGGYP